MVFPATTLDLRTELLLSGTWTDISYPYTMPQGSGCQITRGLPDESGQAQPSQMTMTLNNADGRFSSRNPTGPYYGSIGRNTQIRVSVPEGASYMRLETDGFSFFSTPDAAALDITGDTEVQVDVTLDNWASNQILCSKWTASGNQRSWILYINDDLTLTFVWSNDGTNFAGIAISTIPLTVPALGRMAIKATLATGTGTVTFFTSDTINGTWTQFGTAKVLGANTVFNSTAPVRVGAPGTTATADLPVYTGLYGKVHAFKLLQGIGGTVKASPDFTARTAGTTSFADAQGNTWSRVGTAEISDRKYRFHGEVPEWPITWDMSGRAVLTSITASGVMRRLGRRKPLRSALMRYWTRLTTNPPVAYWPCEDAPRSRGFASPLAGVRPLQIEKGHPQIAADSSFACSSPLPVINGSYWEGPVPFYSGNDAVLTLLVTIPPGGDQDGALIAGMKFNNAASLVYAYVRYNTAAAGTLTMFANDSGIGLVLTDTFTGVNGTSFMLRMTVKKSGSDSAVQMSMLLPGGSVQTTAVTAGQIYTGGTVGRATRVFVNTTETPNLQTISVGHLAVQGTWANLSEFAVVPSPLTGYQFEPAGTRIQRLCSEENVPFRSQGRLSVSTLMGAQLPVTLMSILQDCADADRGFLTEPRQVFALNYRTRASLYHQSVATALTYASGGQGQVSDLQPTDDDQYTSNDVTVALLSGSSSRAVQTTGPLSTQDPPNGVGVYDTQVTLNLAADGQANDLAGWLLHLGTINEPRYQNTLIHLARSNLTSLLTALQETDIGDRYTVTGPTPAWVPPDGISQLIRQYNEQLGLRVWDVAWQSIPESAYETFVVADPILGKVDTEGSSLASSATSTAGSLSVASSGDLWTTAYTAGWSFTVSGTPGDAVHFIVTTGQAASITVGDIFTDTTNPTQAFRVTNVGTPFAGFVNISFTPNAGSNMNNPDVVSQSGPAGDFPFDWNIAGERVTVAKITGASSPQTALVVRSVNGVVKAQGSGAAVSLFFPAIVPL